MGTAEVRLPIRRDNLVEGSETVILTAGCSEPGFTLVTPMPQTTSIADDPPMVSLSVIDSYAGEVYGGQADTARVHISRTGGDLNTPLPVAISFTGTATYGQDYNSSTGTTIDVGAAAEFDLSIIDDEIDEGEETIVATLGEGSYLRSDPITGTVAVRDNDYTVTVFYSTTGNPAKVTANAPTEVTIRVTQGPNKARVPNVRFPGAPTMGGAGITVVRSITDDSGEAVYRIQADQGTPINTVLTLTLTGVHEPDGKEVEATITLKVGL